MELNKNSEEILDREQDYEGWWLAQFPCPCGHPPEDHFLCPDDGKCRACTRCHGEGGSIANMGLSMLNKPTGDWVPLSEHLNKIDQLKAKNEALVLALDKCKFYATNALKESER